MRYGDLGDGSLGKVVQDLTRGRVRAGFRAHLDPDLDSSLLARQQGWRPAFGQTGAAQAHLDAHGIGPGDLFLFFGWFRDVDQARDGKWRFLPSGRNLHAIFGWLQVGQVLKLPLGVASEWEQFPWLCNHPHVRRGAEPGNTVYIAADRFALPAVGDTGLPGAGIFLRASQTIFLTGKLSTSRSFWQLPGWFAPSEGRPALTYHADPARWTRTGDEVLLRSVARGQEFILDCADRPEAQGWLTDLLNAAS